jgi:lysyl endopeptidase
MARTGSRVALLLIATLACAALAGAAEPPILRLPAVDHAALLEEDARNAGPGIPLRFALPVAMAVTPDGAGSWEALTDGSERWRLQVHSPGAVNLNFGFRSYAMPEGGELRIYTPDKEHAIRPFTARDNKPHGELWTPILPGEAAVLDVTVPAGGRRTLDLLLVHVGHGYRAFGNRGAERSGACNVDVICPEGDGWRDPIRSVAVIGTGGSTFCTGFMVNNTAQDLTPYFMTAKHCGIGSGNAASLVVYWNYENSWCRPPGSPASGGPGDGSLAHFQTGSTWRSDYTPSDFTLVELDELPDPDWDVYWAGWDRTSNDFAGAIAIHHPSTDEKRISFEDDPTTTTSYLGTTSPGDGTHVRVADWDLGTTEPGSSGSPLFNPAQRVIGQLHGGYAACGNDLADWYGRFSVSWTGGGTSSSRLSNWLDALGTGAEVLDGRGQSAIQVTPGLLAVCQPADAVFAIDVGAVGGSADPVTLSLAGHPAGTTAGFSLNPVTPVGQSTLTLSNTGAAVPGSSLLTVTGTSTGGSEQGEATLVLEAEPPLAPALLLPVDGALNQSRRPTFTWSDTGGSFQIQIATDPGFGSVVVDVEGVTQASFTSAADLGGDVQHWWRVRGTNACGQGGWSATSTFTTAPAPGQCSSGTTPVELFFDDMETGPGAWTTGGTGNTWTMSTARPHSGATSWYAVGSPSVSDQRLVSPPIALPAELGGLLLRFWNYQRLEPRTGGCYDGGIVEVSADDGTTWTQLQAELLTHPYDGPISTGFSNPLGGLDAWCGDPRDWHEPLVDLQAWAGQTVRLRWRVGTDSSVSREGWYVDDVAVQACASSDPLIFADGFASGGTGEWSVVAP